MKIILRRLRGALGNALVWGGMWFGSTFALLLGPYFLGSGRTDLSWQVLRVLFEASLLIGLVGFVTGSAFSAYVASAFRDRKIEDLSPARFALGGSLVPIPIILLLKMWLSAAMGDGWIFMSELVVPVTFAATLGALTGYGTAKLAQKAMSPGESQDELEPGTQRLLNQT